MERSRLVKIYVWARDCRTLCLEPLAGEVGGRWLTDWLYGCMDGWMDGCMDVCMMDGWRDGCMEGWMDGWMVR